MILLHIAGVFKASRLPDSETCTSKKGTSAAVLALFRSSCSVTLDVESART